MERMGGSQMKTKSLCTSIAMAGVGYVVSWMFVPPAPGNMVRHSLRAVTWVRSSTQTGTAEGSGFFVGDHLVVTSYHVVAGSKRIVVEAYTGRRSKVTKIVAASRLKDFAVLRISETAPCVLRPAHGMRAGDDVFALGAPLGMRDTVTKGVLSQLLSGPFGERLVQHTAPISPGSSGGPLLDANGNVVGLNNFYLDEGQNLNFALDIGVVEKAIRRSDDGSGEQIQSRLKGLYERVCLKFSIAFEAVRQPAWEYFLRSDGEILRRPSHSKK